MKNSGFKSQYFNNSSHTETSVLKKSQEKTFKPSKAVKTNMSEQLISPPARVWEKIEKILDEQESRMKPVNKLISESFTADIKRKKHYLATLAGLSLVAGIIWLKR